MKQVKGGAQAKRTLPSKVVGYGSAYLHSEERNAWQEK